MLTTRTRIKVLSELHQDSEKDTSLQQTALDNEHLLAEQAAKKERRRRNIVDELFVTEKTYQTHLDLAHKFFEFPLRFNCLITERQHAHLFSNLEQLLDINHKLLEYMEQSTVGQAFKFLAPFLKLYSTYANNHQQASATLQECLQKNEKFAEFITEQEERPELSGLKIGALLITPVQRIPRYKLLLEDLVENTPEDHHDYIHIKEAAKQVGEIALHINEHVRQHENFQKMLAIQKSFDSSAPNILAPGREFVKEGKLSKVARRGGKMQDRMFFLFSDMLLYGKPKLLDSGGNSYNCCCVLPLRHCQVERVLGSVQRSDGGGMFTISCKQENLLLFSVDPDEAQSWVDTLEASIKKVNLNRQTLRKPSSNKEPVRGKSFRMKLRDRKKDLKRKVGGAVKKVSDSPKKLSPLKAVLSDVDINCLTPPKRTRTTSNSTGSDEAGSSIYEQKNEINLDEWSPGRCQDAEDEDKIAEDDGEMERGYSPEMSVVSASDEDEDGEEGERWSQEMSSCDQSATPRHSWTSDGQTTSAQGEEPDYSSQPWINPKFQRKKSPSCVSWPVRRVLRGGTRVTSSIGGVMDSVRSSKGCSLM